MSNLSHPNPDCPKLERRILVYLVELRAYHRAVRMRRGLRQAIEALEAHGMHSARPMIRERVASILEGQADVPPVPLVPLEPGERRVVSLDEWRIRNAQAVAAADELPASTG